MILTTLIADLVVAQKKVEKAELDHESTAIERYKIVDLHDIDTLPHCKRR